MWLALACGAALALPANALGAVGASVTASAASVGEAGDLTFTISCGTFGAPLDVPSTGQIDYALTGGTEGTDYAPTNGSVACGAGPAATHAIAVDLLDDGLDEPQETLTFTISKGAVFSGEIATPTATARIVDNDLSTASIVPVVRVLEGGTAQLTVTLSQVPEETATISYATDSGSAATGSDFTATSGQLVIPAGTQTGSISVPIANDSAVEKVEGFYVNLSSPVNAVLDPAKTQAAIAVFDDDRAPVPAFSLPKGVAVGEGDRGTVNALFTVTLSSPAAQRTQVAWRTQNFTANLADYTAGGGTLVFEPGQTTKTISVNVKGDRRDEPNEAFGVVLSKPEGATLGSPRSFGIVTDDDGPAMTLGRPKPRPRALVVALGCPATADLCRGTLTAVAGRLKLGAASFELAKGATGNVKLKLARKARAALRKRARRVTFTLTAADRSGAERVLARVFRIRRLR